MKNLLAISWEMPPLSGPRAVQVTRTLVSLATFGWNSRVICFDAASDRYQQDHRVSVETLSGGAVTRLPVRSPEEWLVFRALWRVCPLLKHLPDEKRVWLPSAVAEGRRALREQPADLIVSFAQPWSDHLIGLRLHRETGLPWVAHFSDPWVDSPYHPPSDWLRGRAAAMEAAVVSAATQLVFVNSYTRDRVMAKYPDAWRSRAQVIPQGWEPTQQPVRERRAGGPLHVVYTGRFYNHIRTPDALLAVLANLNRRQPLTGVLDVEFVGAGMRAYEVQARALGLDACVRFSGRLSPSQARERAASADVLLTIDAPASDGPSLFLPSKLVDYLPLGKPILAVTPAAGPSADLVRRLGYVPIAPDDERGLTEALEAMIAAHREQRLTVAPNHAAVAAEYAISETTRAFAGALDLAVGAA